MAAMPVLFGRVCLSTPPWERELLTGITTAGLQALAGLDRRSSMGCLLGQQAQASPWCWRVQGLQIRFGCPSAEGHRLVILALAQGWLDLQVPQAGLTLAARDLLQRAQLVSEARLAALDRRMPAGRSLALADLSRELAGIGWLREADAAFLTRLAPQATWRWR
jgi:hypothetical protein